MVKRNSQELLEQEAKLIEEYYRKYKQPKINRNHNKSHKLPKDSFAPIRNRKSSVPNNYQYDDYQPNIGSAK